MSGINKVILIGRLGKDPELKYANDGKAIANLTLATSEKWKDKNTGQQTEKTEWHRVCAFGRTAEVIGEYLKKGSNIFIEGKLQTRKWQDSEGKDRYTTEVIANNMQMLDSRGQQEQSQPAQQSPAPAQGGDDFSDEIPFMRINGLVI